jgi:hypothetical protein
LNARYNGNFDITRMLEQSNLSIQRCQLIFWVECSVGGYLVLAKTIQMLQYFVQKVYQQNTEYCKHGNEL